MHFPLEIRIVLAKVSERLVNTYIMQCGRNIISRKKLLHSELLLGVMNESTLGT